MMHRCRCISPLLAAFCVVVNTCGQPILAGKGTYKFSSQFVYNRLYVAMNFNLLDGLTLFVQLHTAVYYLNTTEFCYCLALAVLHQT